MTTIEHAVNLWSKKNVFKIMLWSVDREWLEKGVGNII